MDLLTSGKPPNEKKKLQDQISIRIDVKLPDQTADTFAELSYIDLVNTQLKVSLVRAIISAQNFWYNSLE